MIAKLVGYSSVNFKNESTGEQISGTSLYIAFNDENTIGAKCDKVFVRDNKILPKNLKPNVTLNLSFNYKGKIEYIEVKE